MLLVLLLTLLVLRVIDGRDESRWWRDRHRLRLGWFVVELICRRSTNLAALTSTATVAANVAAETFKERA